MRRLAIVVTAVVVLAGCTLIQPLGPTGPLSPDDCFGNVAKSFIGWTTEAELRIGPGRLLHG